jgi:hypothetical protein
VSEKYKKVPSKTEFFFLSIGQNGFKKHIFDADDRSEGTFKKK